MNAPIPAKKLHGLPSHARLHTAVAREIGIAIVTGRYSPGEAMVGEHEASQTLGVSRSAYREAVRMLAAKGLVESRPKTGTRVCPRKRWNLLDPDVLGWILENGPTPAFLTELFELRLAIEPRMAELAAGRRSAEDLARLHAALADMERHEPDSEEAERADRHFHEALSGAAGNELIAQLAATIGASVGYIASQKRSAATHRDSTNDHRLLLEAIEQSDAAAARYIAARIISRGLDDLRSRR